MNRIACLASKSSCSYEKTERKARESTTNARYHDIHRGGRALPGGRDSRDGTLMQANFVKSEEKTMNLGKLTRP
jgi:hypothetical protein